MIGFMSDGTEIELGERQEQAVRAILDWEQGRELRLSSWPMGAGKTVVLATVARYVQVRHEGSPLQDDPYRRKFSSGVR